MIENNLQIRSIRKLMAFQMKFRGSTYDQISQITKYTVQYLESVFWRGGKWFEEYTSWRTYQLEIINERFVDMFIAQATDANQQIVNIARGTLTVKKILPDGQEMIKEVPLKGAEVLKAAQDILDRAGFKAPEKLEVKTPANAAKTIWDRYNSDKAKGSDET